MPRGPGLRVHNRGRVLATGRWSVYLSDLRRPHDTLVACRATRQEADTSKARPKREE